MQANALGAAGQISAILQLDAGGTLSGWVFDPGDYNRRLIVEILGDGISLAIVRADMHVERLLREGHGDGCFGFALALDPRFEIADYELLLANDDRVVAHCSAVAAGSGAALAALGNGSVLWRGGLRLSGRVRDRRGDPADLPLVQGYEGSKRLDTTLRLHAGDALGDAGRQFDLLLPDELADGNLHRLRVVDAAGAELDGSPVSVLVHRGGFRGLAVGLGSRPEADALAEHTLGFLDQLIPASLPFERYPVWSRDFADETALDCVASPEPLGVIIIGRSGSEATLASLGQQRGVPVQATILDVESADCLRFSPSQWRAACSDLAATARAATLVIRAGTILKPVACLAVAAAFEQAHAAGQRASLCVADHEILGPKGAGVPFFGPAFDYERLLSQGYAAGVFAVARLPEITGDPAEPISAYDILFAALEAAHAKKSRIVHIPRVLARVPRPDLRLASASLAAAVFRHLVRSGQPAAVETEQGSLLPLVHVRRPRPEGEVAVIIPTRDRLDLLKPCLASIRARTDHPDYRLVIVDNGSRDQETLDYFRKLSREGTIVLRDDGAFNYARLNNRAVREIASPFACLLNNDVEVLAAGWLAEMQSFFSRRQVGGVGAKLIWPNGMLQHGGVVLGMNFAAGHAYDRYLADEPGYADGILAARECSALTAACLLLRRDDFLRVGGFDETAFPVAFNDVDLCLKLRESGKTLVWSPRAQLLHRESASRTSDRESPAKQARFEKELAELRRRWGHKLVADEYYNPNLNLDAYGFTGLASPPRDRAPRVRQVRF